MATAGPSSSSRSARAPGTDWEDSYFSLDSRYRQLQKRYNEQQEELKRAKVSQRRETTAAARRPAVLSPSSIGGARPRTSGLRSGSFTAQATGPRSSGADGIDARSPGAQSSSDHEFVGNPSATRAQWNDARAGALQVASLLESDPGAGLPDPAMIWGAEGSVQNYVAANALYHANEELRRKLDESSTLVQALQKELSSTRTLCTSAQVRIEDLAQQLHQLVRERDVATQKLATARQSVTDFERTLQQRVSEEERVRFSLESQIAELRSRLVVGADSNELLTRDVRALLSETKEKTTEVMHLRSKLALAEAGLSSQKNTNENLLLELKNLNTQLVEERKRLLVAAHEVQAAAFVRDRVADLEGQVHRLLQERADVEREHNRLMGDFVGVTEDALRHAREEVRADLDDWRAAATHWEEVSQLLYKEVSERTEAHIRCRAECDNAKAQRDMVGVELRSAKEELALCRAKLDVVWPTHARDAEGLTADEVLETFRRRHASFREEEGVGGENKPLVGEEEEGTHSVRQGNNRPSSAAATYAEALGSLPVDSTTAAERIYELQEANAGLVAELERLRLTNDMLQDRVASVTGRHEKETEKLRSAAKEVQSREKAGQRALAQQLDRVQFLEAQVRSLRGYQVDPNTAVQDVAPSENVLELFLGQLVGAEVPAQMEVPEAFSQLFCSADFLLHETITTPTITGLNGFFDTTISFRISMDALLLYYLQTRRLLVQLHRVRSSDETDAAVAATDTALTEESAQENAATRADGAASLSQSPPATTVAERMFETVAEGEVSLLDLVSSPQYLDAARPTLRGHVRLFSSSGRHVASLEFQLTARTPFTEEFKQMVRDATLALPPKGSDEDGKGSSPQQERGGGGGSPQADAASSVSSTQLSRGGMREWLRRSSSATSSSSSDRRREHGVARQPKKRQRAPRRGTPTGMLLVSTNTPAGRDDRSHSRRYGGGSATSSLDSSSLSRQIPSDALRRGGGDGDTAVRTRLRGAEGAHPSDDDHLPHRASILPPPPPLPQPDSSSFAHIARSLLLGGDRSTAEPSAAPPSPSSWTSPSAATQAIHSVAVDVVRLELPADLPTPIPRLSCYFSLSALHREVRLAAPASPQYTIEYEQMDARLGTVSTVGSLSELAALAREPLTFFFIDEDAPRGSPAVWAMALCEWTGALAAPEVVQVFTLPLLQQMKGTNGKLERRLVRGGVVRVRLLASTEASPAPLQHAGGDLGLLQQGWPPETDATAPVHSFLPENQQTPNAKGQRAAGVPPSAALSPSPLTALQQLMQQVREGEARRHHGQPAAAAATTTPTSAVPPANRVSAAQEAVSMDEQLMRLEYERMLRR